MNNKSLYIFYEYNLKYQFYDSVKKLLYYLYDRMLKHLLKS